MRAKKIFAIIISMILAYGLIACAAKPEPTETEGNTPETIAEETAAIEKTDTSEVNTADANVKSGEAESKLKWWQNTLVYEAYPSSFKDTDGNGYGDIPGITSELDYLASLGVGAIWITPIFASPMKDNGYDVSDYFSINPLYGTMEDVETLIAEADKRNIKIVMDMVFNHTSDECEWFKESSSGKDNDKSDWYIWADAKEDGSAPNNWRGIFGGSAWTWSETRQQYYLHTFADFQPDLNWENPDVRNKLFEVANFWVDKGVGGFRVDAVTYIKKPNPMVDGEVDAADNMAGIHKMTANTEGILDFLHEFKEKVQDGTDIFVVGEANGVPNEQLSDWVGENGVFDMIFSFDLVNIQFANGEYWYNTKDFNLTEFKKIIGHLQTDDNGVWNPVFLENHDQPRSVNHFLKGDADPVNGAKALAMLLMTLRGTPFIYQGEELGMTNVNRDTIEEYNDISSHNQYKMALENGLNEAEALACVQRFSRDNARSPMQWDTTDNAGFTSGKPWLAVADNYLTVNAATEDADETSVLNWYRKLNELRQEHPVFIDGSFTELREDSEELYEYIREDENEKILVVINFTGHEVDFIPDNSGTIEFLISSYGDDNGGILRPYEAMCYIYK